MGGFALPGISLDVGELEELPAGMAPAQCRPDWPRISVGAV